MTVVDILVIVVILALIPAAIAKHKGHDFFTWWIFGFLLLIVALPASLLIKDKRPRCPECAENVKAEAKRCPHCQADIEGRIVVYKTPSPGPGANYEPLDR